MKQTILALGAAAALGFAGASHAIAYFGTGNPANHKYLPLKADLSTADPAAETTIEQAEVLRQAAGGVGHMLFMPYYNVQNGTDTMFNITNTDQVNGKAVKVRLRGASNSDDVMDFTLLLSPADMWTAMLTYKAGVAKITTSDNSCTMPYPGDIDNQPLSYDRVLADVAAPTKSILVSEGYIEVLGMADIPPDSVLYKDIKHVGGVPGNCTSNNIRNLWETLTAVTADEANAAGLYPNTGGLMGSWMLLNQNNVATYSGNMTAIRAETQADGQNAYGNIVFAPQSDTAIPQSVVDGAATTWPDIKNCKAGESVGCLTADPLLGGKDGVKKALKIPQWFDLPDMSTPLLSTFSSPTEQVVALDLGRNSIYNEWFSAPESAAVPMAADWVISQPTRRYYAAVDYKGKQMVWNLSMGSLQTAAPGAVGGSVNEISMGEAVDAPASNNPYTGLAYKADPKGGMGAFACLTSFEIAVFDREEGEKGAVAGKPPLSPRASADPDSFCGEVFAMTFGENSVLNAAVATSDMRSALPDGKTEGWAQLKFTGTRLPVVGFAATQFSNKVTGKHYGETWPHRWDH